MARSSSNLYYAKAIIKDPVLFTAFTALTLFFSALVLAMFQEPEEGHSSSLTNNGPVTLAAISGVMADLTHLWILLHPQYVPFAGDIEAGPHD